VEEVKLAHPLNFPIHPFPYIAERLIGALVLTFGDLIQLHITSLLPVNHRTSMMKETILLTGSVQSTFTHVRKKILLVPPMESVKFTSSEGTSMIILYAIIAVLRYEYSRMDMALR
jgi:hypothetical protein